jgi:hypothetical protein
VSIRIGTSFFMLAWVFSLNIGAEEKTDKLPNDGWWIRYSWIEKQEVNGKIQEYSEKATYSLVGTTIEGGEKCRWVEDYSVASLRDRQTVVCKKFLVSEKDLLDNEQPLKGLKRAWVKRDDQDVRAMKLGHGITSDSPSLRIFPGVWQNAERLKKERTVDYQKGRLTISEARTQEVKTPINTRLPSLKKRVDSTLIVKSTVWFDPVTSPVFAAASFDVKTYNDNVLESSQDIEMVVEDIGNDAQSKLPENN